MKVLILFVFCLSVIGCGRRGERIHNIRDLDQDQLNIVNNKFDIDIIAVDLNTRSRRNIKPICKAIDGCLKVCEYFDKAKCKQLSIDKVLVFWMNQISMYSQWEQARNDLNLIATEPKVSDFLSNVDKNNQVMEALFNLSIAANCPINDQPNILFSYTPHVSLYLGAPKETSAPQVDADAGEDLTDLKAAAVEADAAKEALVTAKTESEAAQEAVAVAEAEVVTAQGALRAAENAKAGLTADASEGEVTAADAKIAETKAAVDAAEAKVVAAKETLAAVEENMKMDIPEKQMPVSSCKKIMDGQVLYFNLPIFAGYIKKCFGFNSKTFSEMALEIENKKAFKMGDRVISKACSENSECIRLSYCAIDSELVWNHLKPSVKAGGCDYENFSEMLP